MAILVDAGPLYALADADDRNHGLVVEFVSSTREPLIVPSPVVPEVCYLLLSRLGQDAELAFLRSLANQELMLEHPSKQDFERMIEILEQYRESRFGMADASVMAMAERLRIESILTLDRRDFSIFRPRHCDAFELLPPA